MLRFIDIIIDLFFGLTFIFMLTLTSSMLIRYMTVSYDYKITVSKNRFDNKL